MNRHESRKRPDHEATQGPDVAVPISDAELAFKLQQTQGAIISDFDRLVRGRLDTHAREHLSMQLADVALDLLRPVPLVVDLRVSTGVAAEDDATDTEEPKSWHVP